MDIIEVSTKRERREFIDLPKRLYRDDPYWVCPLDSEIENVFDPARNHAFRDGVAKRWILKDGKTTIGRVAAFIDRRRSAANKQPTGGMGFFEVEENREAAFVLFDTVRQWLYSEGMEAMDGPVNFGENDNHWGLLVEGFMQQAYGMPYNKKCYRDFFEAYGFKNYFEQYSNHRSVRNEKNEIVVFPERFMRIAERISKRPGYSFRHFQFRESKKFIEDICEIYNSTWIYLKDDFTPIDPVILEESLRKARMLIDEELIWFAYLDNKPVGFFVIYPDANQILKYFNGKMNLLNKIRFLYLKRKSVITRARAVVGGVHHEHQNKGVESAIFFKLYQAFKKKEWLKELELSWVGDYNPKMSALYDALGAVRAKKHITYRYMINDKIPFKRYVDELAEKEQDTAQSALTR